jgi:ABC-type bacteriocin/lantibiotic exporter with double-glycine peptidase domain
MESFAIKNLMFSYPQQESLVLDDISLSILKGQFVVLCGRIMLHDKHWPAGRKL